MLTASFRFGLATDTLAVQLALPLAGCASDFNRQVSAPCRAHIQKAGRFRPAFVNRFLEIRKLLGLFCVVLFSFVSGVKRMLERDQILAGFQGIEHSLLGFELFRRVIGGLD